MTALDPLSAALQAEMARRVAEAVAAERQRIVATLRAAAEGRREYAKHQPRGGTWDHVFELLDTQASTLDAAARVVEGDLQPLYGWLPSWRWTDEMVAALHGEKSAPEPPPTSSATPSP